DPILQPQLGDGFVFSLVESRTHLPSHVDRPNWHDLDGLHTLWRRDDKAVLRVRLGGEARRSLGGLIVSSPTNLTGAVHGKRVGRPHVEHVWRIGPNPGLPRCQRSGTAPPSRRNARDANRNLVYFFGRLRPMASPPLAIERREWHDDAVATEHSNVERSA